MNATRQRSEVQSSQKKDLTQQKRISSVNKTKFVAAIEIGTCNTRMAFCCKPLTGWADHHILIMNDWKEPMRGALTVPTTILFNHTKEVIAYGIEEERCLSEVERPSVYFFKYFIKVLLDMKMVSLPTSLCECMADSTQCFTILYTMPCRVSVGKTVYRPTMVVQ